PPGSRHAWECRRANRSTRGLSLLVIAARSLLRRGYTGWRLIASAFKVGQTDGNGIKDYRSAAQHRLIQNNRLGLRLRAARHRTLYLNLRLHRLRWTGR